ncbi:hypothetical protein [Sutcliffiella horikoshii]|uniref:hypothetical protein n=1 Tax=Sutcliffiella horikoshii TaxID=79883 RepID=UPI001CFDB85E|nr:hypothetical protein [Sutcliffiella horikoshii]
MVWMYIGIAIILLIGSSLIIFGFKLTKEKHKKEEYIGNTAGCSAGIVETILLFSLSFLLKSVPYWLMKVILFLVGSMLIIFGVFLLSN